MATMHVSESELALFPKNFSVAAKIVGRNSVIRKELHKKLGASGHRWQGLKLKSLESVDKLNFKKINATSHDASTISFGALAEPVTRIEPVSQHLKRVIEEIRAITWLDSDEKEALANVFIGELAIRYNQARDMISKQLTPEQNRVVIANVIEKIALIKDTILERGCWKKKRMHELSVLNPALNKCRFQAYFRSELCRRIDTQKIMKQALEDTCNGKTVQVVRKVIGPDPLEMEIQEVKNALEQVTHPTPDLPPLQISSKRQTELLRRSIRRASSSEAKEFVDSEGRRLLSGRRRSSHRGHAISRRGSILERRSSRGSQMLGNMRSSVFKSWRSLRGVGVGGLLEVEEWGSKEDNVKAEEEEWGFLDDSETDDDSDDTSQEEDDDNSTKEFKDNPLLLESSILPSFRRRHQQTEEPLPQRQRYLPPSKYRRRQLVDFDYGLFDALPVDDETMPLASPTTSSTDPEPKFQDERYPILRPLPSTTSTRIPKGFITLNTEPSPVVSGFEDGPEQLMLKKIDENLTQYKEVSDIYAEIMEVVPAASVAFQDLEDDPFRCPTAPLDHSAATSQFDYAWRGLKDPVLTRPFLSLPDTAGEYRNQFDEYREQRGKSQIRMRTRDGTEQAPKRPLTAEAYIADRTKAMRRTLSSRYGTLLKHNYGGYIPPLKSKTVVPPVITFRNYLQFLDSLQTDFVFTLLYEEDAEMEARKRRQEELEERLKSEEEERQKEEAARLKEERRQAMTRYERGMWNKGVLDYMGEVMGKHEERVNKSGGGVHTVDSDDEKKSKADHDTGEQEAETTISLTELQTALEELWVQLKMPVDQKLDMAIKYGRHQYTPKVETSLRLWREVTTLILARESLLEEISAFEQTASDPTRFFLAGQPGSSEARMEEARAREQLLRKSHELSQQIMQLCDRIRKQLDEVVTYEGVPYTEKMRRDYTEIVRKAGREKLKEQSSVTVDSS